MIKFKIQNTGKGNISVRCDRCECILLRPKEEVEVAIPKGDNIIITHDNQPHAIAALGAYN
jgi:hypothetical protein